MQTVYFLPGFAGSELFLPSIGRNKIWVGYGELAVGGFSTLGLASDGVTPSSPCGQAVTVGGPLEDYYGPFMDVLADQLHLNAYLRPWGWDWRKDIIAAGQLLATDIENTSAPGNPCVIIGHSTGGLVARVAWSILDAAGKTSLVKRIIAIATPNQGSYAAVQLISGGNSILIGLAGISYLTLSALGGVGFPIPDCFASSLPKLVSVILTWPCLYELLPFLGSVDQAQDPNRPAIYNAEKWSNESISQSWLNYASTVFDPLMNGPSALPPASALTTFGGIGFDTPDILTNPQYLGGIAAYGSTVIGDGCITEEDALVPASWQYNAVCKHMDLPMLALTSGVLLSEIQANRSGTTPIPPVTFIQTPGVMTLGSPPFAATGFPPGVVSGGRGQGDC